MLIIRDVNNKGMAITSTAHMILYHLEQAYKCAEGTDNWLEELNNKKLFGDLKEKLQPIIDKVKQDIETYNIQRFD